MLRGRGRVRALVTALPPLPYPEWEPTKETLHLWAQIVGKVKLASAPPKNHWWHVPLYLDVHGLTTRLLLAGSGFEIRFDFVGHRLVVETAGPASVRARRRPVRRASTEHCTRRSAARLDVTIRETPFGVPTTTPFPRTREHASYDRERSERFWQALDWSADVLEEFAGWFCGKQSRCTSSGTRSTSPLTRFSGRRGADAPRTPTPSPARRTHEVSRSASGRATGRARAQLLRVRRPGAGRPRDGARSGPPAIWVDQGTGSLAALPYDACAPPPSAGRAARLPRERVPGRRRRRRWDRAALASTWCPYRRHDAAPAADARRRDPRLGIATIDGTIVNVALPAIEDDLGGGLQRSSGSRTPTCSRSAR